MRNVFYVLFFFLAAAIFSNCGSGSDLDQPPQIMLGQDPCDECRMIINEVRFAAAYTTADGQRRFFDDIGCMIVHHNKLHESAARFWVADFRDGRWLPAEKALFIVGSEIPTPMAFGVIAIDQEEYAQGQPLQGRQVSFKELLAMKLTPGNPDK